jgi:hypothetical protein
MRSSQKDPLGGSAKVSGVIEPVAAILTMSSVHAEISEDEMV